MQKKRRFLSEQVRPQTGLRRRYFFMHFVPAHHGSAISAIEEIRRNFFVSAPEG
ncbi:MAG: hypothetical protein HFI90_07780 [Clostridia bacterium]|nr:hypothetical protein [Clostridia bacterium]